jgi:hypothetical protein
MYEEQPQTIGAFSLAIRELKFDMGILGPC